MTAIAGAAASERPGRVRWVMIALVLAIAAVSFLDRSNISIAAPFLRKDLAIDDKQIGLVFTAFSLGYALMQPFAGRMADRFGARRSIAIGVVLWSVLTSATAMITPALSGGFAILLLVRVALGVGEAIIFPASNRLVANWIPPRERGLANGLVFSGVGLGAGIAPPLITMAIAADGWRWGFWLCAAIGVAMLLVWLLVSRERPEDHPWVRMPELRHIEEGKVSDKATNSNGILRWGVVVRSRQVLLLTLAYFCFGYVAFIFFTWFFTYLSTVRGLDLKSSGLYATLPFIGMAIASPLGGLISDVLAKRAGAWVGRCLVASIGMFAAGGFLIVAPQVTDARLASLVLACGSGALYLSQSGFWTLSANLGRASAGSVSGFMNMGCQLGAVAVSFVTPYIAGAWGWSMPFAATGVFAVVGGLAWLFVDPHATLRDGAAIEPGIGGGAAATGKPMPA